MKRNIILAAGAALAVTAGVQVMAADAGIRPGEYETTTRMTNIQMPSLPAAAKQKMLTKVETKKQCITAEKIKAGGFGASSKNCRATQSTMAGGKINMASQCMGGSTEKVVGTYTPNGYNITVTAAGGAGFKGGSMTFNQVGRRIGECSEAAEDGE